MGLAGAGATTFTAGRHVEVRAAAGTVANNYAIYEPSALLVAPHPARLPCVLVEHVFRFQPHLAGLVASDVTSLTAPVIEERIGETHLLTAVLTAVFDTLGLPRIAPPLSG